MADHIVKHRFHGRRKGKTLTAYRQSLLDDDLAHYQIPSPIPAKIFNENLASLPSPLREREGTTYRWEGEGAPGAPTWLEIGFGNGEFLSAMAQKHPEINFIGCEPFMNGVAALLASIDEPIDNLKIWPDDVRILMDEIPDGSIDRVYLLNPDPWPKARHEKRRFIQNKNLDEISRILKPNGYFTMSTDVPDLADYMFEKTKAHDDYQWLDKNEDDKFTPPADWPIDKTRYMKKALGGEAIYWLRFQKI